MKKLLALLLALVLGFLSLLPTTPTQKVEAAPPANFQVNQIIGNGLEGPSGFEFAPDGRIFILQRTGEIRVYKNGQLLEEPFAVLPSVATGDRGLIGIAFDPDFQTNNYVYFYYTGTDLLNRLVRFDASGDVGTNGPFILYETTFPSQQLHVGGSIRFGADGKLYFAVGDNGYPPNAQDLTNPHGKILRINKDGTIPADNPFVGQPGKLPEIWAYGFRNPWRFQFDSQTQRLYGGDVGDFTIEEVNKIEKGKNYGWPLCEGVCGQAGLEDPIYNYPHDGQGSAVTGGPAYRSNMFPPEYNGVLFFGDYARGFIKYLTLDAEGNSTGVHDFDLSAGSVVDLKVANDGSLYFVTYFPGRLYRVTYSTGNQIPVASAGADDTKGIEPFTVNFTSAGSFDPDGDPLSYLWDFGDGTTSAEANPIKTYTDKGTYIVELQVSDGTNSSNAVPIVIQVGTPPTVTIGEPENGSTYKAGDTIHYSAFAQDGAGFDINDANIETEVIFHHNTHTHPFLGPIQGRQATFTVPKTGEAAADTWYRIQATATDDNGLSTTTYIEIFPEKSFMTFASNIPGATIFLDGVPTITNAVYEQVVGFVREVKAPLMQVVNGILYQFANWSDGGAIKHLVTISDSDSTIIANYNEAPAFNAEYFNNNSLTGTPTLTRQDNQIDFAWGEASPDPALPVDGFSARWQKDQHFHAGTYKFTAVADDGMRVWLDDELILDEWQDQAQFFEVTKEITEGIHNIRVEYYENAGGATARLLWDLASSQPGTLEQYTAHYFDNINLIGEPQVLKTENIINHDWGQGSPDPTVPADFFSARWTKTANFAAGNYEFTTTSDDGVRLFVDGELVLNKWIDQPATAHKATKLLTAGTHTIVLEYYEKTGAASMSFSYQIVEGDEHDHTDSYTAHYWNTPGTAESPTIPATEPDFEDHAHVIDFLWHGTSPAPAINPDHFGARYERVQHLEAGTYRFTATADDGIRVFIDNNPIIDEWADHASTTYTADLFLTEGDHEIKVEYYENAGGAVLQFGYEKLPDPETSPYNAQFWNMPPGSSPTIPATPPDLVRVDSAVNFSWNDTSPDPSISNEHFVARWTKEQEFSEGTYKFTTLSDDGVRVFVDNELVIDLWADHAETPAEADVPLTSGVHNIRVEYYENGGGATAKFNYIKISNETTAIEKFSSSYFNNMDLSGEPTLTRNDKTINFNWGLGSPDSTISPNNFSARLVKNKVFEEGTYNFILTADDGVKLYIDGILALNEWEEHDSETFTITQALSAGTHEIKIEYFENTGRAKLIYIHEKL